MLLEDFYTYTIDSQDDNSIELSIEINKDHQIFEGHFPGIPIVPGVCQIQMVKEILSKHLNKKLQLKTSKAIKFLGMLNPNETTSIKGVINYKPSETGTYVNAILSNENSIILKLSGEYCER